MLEPGQFNLLTVIGTRGDSLILDGGPSGGAPSGGGPSGQITLTRGPGEDQYQLGDQLEVFVYPDADGGLIATTTRPLATMGQVAWLQVAEVNAIGAFADWGLPKDLFIPFAEQQHALRKGQHTLVKVYLDNQRRLAGSTRIDHWIKDDASGLVEGEAVSLVIADKTELGFKAVINHRCWGLLYGNELFQPLRKGQVITGYIKRIRPDDKIDLTLTKPGFDKSKIAGITQQIITQLEAHGGRLALTDKSPPEEIYATFGVSKKIFKQALGALYKQRRISLEPSGIRLIEH